MLKSFNKLVFVTALFFAVKTEGKEFPKSNPLTVSSYNAEEWRFGLGTGFSFYQGNQRNYNEITRNFGVFTEFKPSFVFEVFKQYDASLEFGARLTHGTMETLKSNNTLGLYCEFDDIQFNGQYSLNNNIDLRSSAVTFNLQAGLGFVYFKSYFFGVNPNLKTMDRIYASVGYQNTLDGQFPGIAVSKKVQNKPIAIIGNVGFNIGLRVTPILHLYWQNNFAVSTSNKMSGNLFKRSWIPPDGYLYTGILLSIRMGAGPSRYGCPKF